MQLQRSADRGSTILQKVGTVPNYQITQRHVLETCTHRYETPKHVPSYNILTKICIYFQLSCISHKFNVVDALFMHQILGSLTDHE